MSMKVITWCVNYVDVVFCMYTSRGSDHGERWLRGRAPDCQSRGRWFSPTPTTVSKLRQFRSPHICLCHSEDTLKAGGPFYLVSMPGEVKDLTHGVNCMSIAYF